MLTYLVCQVWHKSEAECFRNTVFFLLGKKRRFIYIYIYFKKTTTINCTFIKKDGNLIAETARKTSSTQTAVTVFVASESDRQCESVILDCDNLVRPSCQSASFQHTRAGSSDKPVPLNNTKERQAENTPCCVNQLIGRTTWAEGTKGPEGQTRVGQLLLILLSFVLGFSFNLKGQRGDFLTEEQTCCLCLPWPAQLVQQMLMIQVNAAAPFMPYWLHCVHASREWLCRSAHCVLQQSNSNHIWHRVR